MAKGLGISGILNPESIAQAKGSHTVSYLGIDKIHEHDKNRQFDPHKIELLARDIEDVGLQSPIVVAATGSDEYVVISGHRRLSAFRLLAAEGKDKFRVIPAICRTGLDSKQIEEMLYDGNLYTEQLSPAELAAQLAWKKQRLLERKEAGEKISGKMLDLIAEELGINAEAARRMDTINRRAVPEVKKEFAAGNMSLREAFKVSQMPTDEQNKLIQKKQTGEAKHLVPDKKKVVRVPPEDASSRDARVVRVPPESISSDPGGGVHEPPESAAEEETTYAERKFFEEQAALVTGFWDRVLHTVGNGIPVSMAEYNRICGMCRLIELRLIEYERFLQEITKKEDKT